MPKPDRLRVGLHDWTVEWVSLDDSEGECSSRRLTITVDPGIAKQLQRSVLLHEVFHAVWYEMGVTAADDAKEIEESVVNPLAQGVLGVLRDNPKFSRWLSGG